MKRQLRRAMVGSAAFAVTILAVPLGIAVRHMYQTEQVIRLQRQATLAALQVPAGFARSADPVDLPQPRPGLDVALYNSDGRLVVGRGPSAGDHVVRSALGGRTAEGFDNGRTVVAVPVASAENVIAVVRASEPQSAVLGRAERAWAAIAALAVTAVVAAAVLARVLATRMTGPLESVAAAAYDLGQGDFTITIPPSGIEELDTVGAALTHTAARLGQAVERERSFSADAAHQLITPIATMRLTLERAVEDHAADPVAALSQSLTELDRLEATVESFLALRRDLAAGPHAVEIAQLQEWIRAQWRPKLTAAGRPLHIECEPALPPARVSFESARHVLDVLIDNAYRHGQGAVRIQVRHHRDTVVVNVSDEGPGVARIEGLFDRRPPGGDGHGIGLALARSLVEADGGRLDLTHPGAGPVFTVAWPAAHRPGG